MKAEAAFIPRTADATAGLGEAHFNLLPPDVAVERFTVMFGVRRSGER